MVSEKTESLAGLMAQLPEQKNGFGQRPLWLGALDQSTADMSIDDVADSKTARSQRRVAAPSKTASHHPLYATNSRGRLLERGVMSSPGKESPSKGNFPNQSRGFFYGPKGYASSIDANHFFLFMAFLHALKPEDSPWNWDLLWKRSVSKEQQITRSFETKKEDFHSLMVHTHKAPFYNPYDLVHLPALSCLSSLILVKKASAAAMMPLQRRTFEETGGIRPRGSTPAIPKTPEGKRVMPSLLRRLF